MGFRSKGVWELLPPKAETVCKHLQILTAETIKIRDCEITDTLILDQCVSRWGTYVTFCGGLAPKPMFGAATVCMHVMYVCIGAPFCILGAPLTGLYTCLTNGLTICVQLQSARV